MIPNGCLLKFLIQITEISRQISTIFERFISTIDQFNTNYLSLNQWLEENTREVNKELELSTLETANERLKMILNTGISLQNDLKSLEESLENINSIIQDFQSLTNNNTGRQISINLLERMQFLTQNYTHFLQVATDSSAQCEYYALRLQQINQLSDVFLQSITEVDHQLTCREQLDQLTLLTTHEPLSIKSIPIDSQIKTHVSND